MEPPAEGGESPGADPSRLLNLPNLLSLLRILLVPLLVVVLLTESRFEGKEYAALALFLLAALTDVLDGFIARRRGQITRLGKLLDPAADKILTSSALVSLVGLGVAPAWIVVVILGREFAVSAIRSLAAADRVVVAAIRSAKLKTTLQVVAISLLIVALRQEALLGPARVALWAAMLVSLWSGTQYFVRLVPPILGRQRS